MSQSDENRVMVESIIKDFVADSPENTLRNEANEKAFAEPIVGFAGGDDPLFEEYRDHVGPFHLTPLEIFSLTFRSDVKPEELTVISYILPQMEASKADNRKETVYPSERWARARIFGEETNRKLREHVATSLTTTGYQAVAPSLTPQFSSRISPKYGMASTWSERHAAYAAGLGTFGLCDGLITPLGKAMRTGAIVARIQIPPTPRPYTDHMEYCLFFSQGICGECMPRCPAGAITDKGKDKQKCLGHLFPGTAKHVKENYGFDGYGCGLCQTGVPCESKIPTAEDVGKDNTH